MDPVYSKIDLRNLDKSGWISYRFEEIASKISEVVDPKNTQLSTYVGLEHLDPEDIHIRRFGTPGDVSGNKLKCYPGDVIFGKRRAYQRKAAVIDVEGICSAHAFVFRANPDVIDPKLFPFFLHSDQFMHRAVDISVGGLSPTINWSDLRGQEFLLPPKDQQARLAELLWAMDEVVNVYMELLVSLQTVLDASLTELFSNPNKVFSKWEIVQLKKVSKIQSGIAKGKKYNGEELFEYPYLRVANVQDGFLDLSEIKTIKVTRKEIERYSLDFDDVLLTEGGDFDKLGRGTIWKSEISPCLHQNHIFCVKPNKEVLNSEFLSFQTGSQYGKRYFLINAKKTSNLASINLTQVSEFPVILPSKKEQLCETSKLLSIKNKLNEVKQFCDISRALQKSLIHQIF